MTAPWFERRAEHLPASYYQILSFRGEIRALSAEQQGALIADGTWNLNCPVAPYQLRAVTLSYWDFSGLPHFGQLTLLINKSLAKQVLAIFQTLYQHQFPIDANNTSAYNCRSIRGITGIYSEHSYGRAIDINSVQNPISIWKDDKYLDRSRVYEGMITPDGIVVKTFQKYGWTWGGSWNSPKDYMHFEKTRPSLQAYMKISHRWPDVTHFIYNPNYR